MKKIFDLMPDWLLTIIFSIFFIVTWPILLIIFGVKSLFGDKSSDSEKIYGAKVAVATLIGVIVVSIIVIYERPLRIILDSFPLKSFFVFVVGGLLVLSILQKVFPNIKWLQKK